MCVPKGNFFVDNEHLHRFFEDELDRKYKTTYALAQPAPSM